VVTCSHTGALEFHCEAVDVDWVWDFNKLFIITFALEVYNGASSSINQHYKCGHIIATLHPNVTVYNLGDICMHLCRHS